jgi:hypothetical protein
MKLDIYVFFLKKNCPENLSLVTIRQKQRAIYVKTDLCTFLSPLAEFFLE